MTKIQLGKKRIAITQVFAVVMFTLILISSSAWEIDHPILSEVWLFLGIVFVGIASLGRMWCSLYIAGKKNRILVQHGPYSTTRNPLYFFSFIGLLGVGLSTESLSIPLLMALAFFLYYPGVINMEENGLKELYGKEFEDYMVKVPRFFPNLKLLKEPLEIFVNPLVYRRHVFSALWFVWVVGFLAFTEALHEKGIIPVLIQIY